MSEELASDGVLPSGLVVLVFVGQRMNSTCHNFPCLETRRSKFLCDDRHLAAVALLDSTDKAVGYLLV